LVELFLVALATVVFFLFYVFLLFLPWWSSVDEQLGFGLKRFYTPSLVAPLIDSKVVCVWWLSLGGVCCCTCTLPCELFVCSMLELVAGGSARLGFWYYPYYDISFDLQVALPLGKSVYFLCFLQVFKRIKPTGWWRQ
jgi:hypothetical protein